MKNKNQHIFAGVVTYNPDMERLKENLQAIYKQVKEVVVFDNNSCNVEKIKQLILDFNNITIICENKNQGIAVALNKLMTWGSEKGYKWMLSLDQDSICANGYIKMMHPYISLSNVGIICPKIVDRNLGGA